MPATDVPVSAPAVWPTPQQQNSRTDGFALSTTVALVTGAATEASAVRVVESVLTSAGVTHIVRAADQQRPSAAPVVVWVGGRSENVGSAGALGALSLAGPAGLAAEGYVLGIGRGADGQARVVLAGVDPTGTFYAAQTLRQLVVAQGGRHWLPGVSIRDWPATPLRGVVEGFYGPPWSTADRLSQLDFLASTKQNVYVYSPKDDPYLRAQWRQPYPPDQLAVIRQLSTGPSPITCS
jgi:hyaluronoglucosaminidase